MAATIFIRRLETSSSKKYASTGEKSTIADTPPTGDFSSIFRIGASMGSVNEKTTLNSPLKKPERSPKRTNHDIRRRTNKSSFSAMAKKYIV